MAPDGFCNTNTGERPTYLTHRQRQRRPERLLHRQAIAVSGIVGGTCKGYAAKPSLAKPCSATRQRQACRDIPDVSLFAANGVWGHYYVYCDSDALDRRKLQRSVPSNVVGCRRHVLLSSPILAGMQALVNQKQGSAAGQPEPHLLCKLAATRNTALPAAPPATHSKGNDHRCASCIFHDVTKLGDMDVNCTGTHNCYLPGGTNGVLSTSDEQIR